MTALIALSAQMPSIDGKGMEEYSGANLEKRPKALDMTAGLNLNGCNVLVTGGGSGIGYEITRAFACRGASVTIADLNQEQSEQAAERIRLEAAKASVTTAALDLSSFASVRAFAENYLKRTEKLHVLINNAGIMAPEPPYTIDGMDAQFVVNYLGHFLLSLSLLPALKAAGSARIVTATSIAHRRSPINFSDIHFRHTPYDAWKAYGQSNTATALLGVEFTARYRDWGITANAAMPGGVMTGLQKNIPREKQIELGWIDETGAVSPIFKTPEQGAATAVWGALAPELQGRGGLYLQNCAIASIWQMENPLIGYMPYALDPLNAKRLWEVSEVMAGINS